MTSSPPPNRRSLWLPLLLGLLQTTSALCADTEIRDQFGLTDRGGGMALNKTFTEKGALPWEASKNVVLGKESGVVVSNSGPFTARVAISANARTITAEAGMRPTLSAESAAKHTTNWVAVGIGHPDTGTPNWGKGICITVDSAGHFACYYNPDPEDWTSKHAVSLSAGTVPEYNPNGMTKVKLQFNVKTKTVNVWVNTIQVVQNRNLEGDQVVDPAVAGFSGFSQEPNVPTVNGFAVTLGQ